jgi:glycosidase
MSSLAHGDIEFIDGPEALLIFERRHEDEDTLCVFNLSEASVSWEPNEIAHWKLELHTNDRLSGRPPALLQAGEAYVASRM